MSDSLKLAEMQRTSIEFERQRHLANWLIKSSPHMANPTTTTTTSSSTAAATGATATGPTTITVQGSGVGATVQQQQGCIVAAAATTTNAGATTTPTTTTGIGVCNGTGGLGHLGHGVEARKPKLRRYNSHDTSSNMFSVADFENARLARRNEIELKLRLARRQRNSANGSFGMGGSYGVNGATGTAGISGVNGYNGFYGVGMNGSGGGDYSTGDSKTSKYSNESQHEPLPADLFLDRYPLPRIVRISYKTKFSDETLQSSSSNGSSTTVTSSSSTGVSAHPMHHSSSNGHTSASCSSGTATSSSTASSSAGINNGNNNNNNNNNANNGNNGNTNNNCNNGTSSSAGTSGSGGSSSTKQQQLQQPSLVSNSSNVTNVYHQQNSGELFLLYRLIRQRHIYHGHNAKNAANNRKKGVLIPQEFPGYFSLLNEKGLPTATQYTSLIQLVRERVYKFVSVDNMPAFTESQPNTNSPPHEGCLPIYTTQPPNSNRPHYIKTTARGGQVFRLLAVFEDGKQDHNAIAGHMSGVCGMNGMNGNGSKSNSQHNSHGREKEKGRYAQLFNENRQVLYVSLSTKGKFYEIEPGIPQILQKLGGAQHDATHKKINPECVHRITALITPNKELPQTLRYISGPSGCASAIPENICITKISTENVIIACPIEDVEMQSPLHLRKLHLTKEMNLIKSYLGFESEQRMLANPNVQNILKYCQFNCDQFLKLVEIEVLNRAERSGSKSRVDGLKILKPLHLPKLLRREKTTIPAHEKEDSIIFLSKSDLANLEAKETAAAVATTTAATHDQQQNGANRITDKMKVFQSTKKKWFKKHDKQSVNSLTSLELDVQAKRMSMERYTDMSKLLQERFGDKSNTTLHEHESISELSGASDIGCSDTETTTLATIEQQPKLPKTHKSLDMLLQKSMSLQDIELLSGGQRKPDLLASHKTTADTISEAGTELDDLENQAPAQSFITEKLYNEFHVKTRQYSKSSSSLHQLLNFSMPQKMQLHEREKRSLTQLKLGTQSSGKTHNNSEKRASEPITGRRAAGGLSLLAGGGGFQLQQPPTMLMPSSLIEDDLPYSSVRDSLVLSSDESPQDEHGSALGGDSNICQALNMIDYAKENIYAEICHEASVMGGIPSCMTRDTFSVAETHTTHISNVPTICSGGDDYGDYASLCYPSSNGGGSTITGASSAGNAISRVQINCCSASPISYHTVYFNDEPLGERHDAQRRSARERNRNRDRAIESSGGRQERAATVAATGAAAASDRAHVTRLELAGHNGIAENHATADFESVDNIYNTLK